MSPSALRDAVWDTVAGYEVGKPRREPTSHPKLTARAAATGRSGILRRYRGVQQRTRENGSTARAGRVGQAIGSLVEPSCAALPSVHIVEGMAAFSESSDPAAPFVFRANSIV